MVLNFYIREAYASERMQNMEGRENVGLNMTVGLFS